MHEILDRPDYEFKVTHHCNLLNMNEDPFGRLYDKLANTEKTDSEWVDIKRTEVNMTKDGIVMVVVFFDKYERINKDKVKPKKDIAEDL